MLKHSFFVVGLILISSSVQARVDKSSMSYQLHAEACRRMNDLPFGGNSQSFFETLSCDKLITQFEAIEISEGASKQRLQKFMRDQNIQYATVAECRKVKADKKIYQRFNYEECVLNVFKLVDRIQLERDFFIKSLIYKVQAYDASFVQNRSLLLNTDPKNNPQGCQTKSDYSSFKRNSRNTLSDCEFIAEASPDCLLKLGSQSDVNLYSASQQAYWKDRQTCQAYINKHLALNEPFARLTQEERKALVKESEKSQETASVGATVNCAVYDPNKPLTLADARSKTAMTAVDLITMCQGGVGTTAGGAGSSSGGAGSRTSGAANSR